jgi:capsular exopolysaccharide synthesis family protein
MALQRQSHRGLGDFSSVLARRWTVLFLALVLSLGWAFVSYKPGMTEYESSVQIRFIPPHSRDPLFGDVSNLTEHERSLEAQANFLTSPEFTRLVAQQAIIEQMAKARRHGPSMIWPGLDAGLKRAAETVTPQVSQDPATQSLTLRFRSTSREQVATAAELVPRMFSKLNESRINRKHIDIKRFIRKKLQLFQDREKDLTQRIWELRGSANAYVMGEEALVQAEKMLADTSLQREVAQASLEEYRAQIDVARAVGVESPDPSDEVVDRLLEKLADLEYDRTMLLRDYTEAHPDVRDVSEEIALTRATLETKLGELIDRGVSAVSPLDSYQRQVTEAMGLEIELGALERKERALRGALGDSIRNAQNIAGFQQQLGELEADAKYFRDLWRQFHSKLVNLELSIEMDREGQGYVEVVSQLVPAPDAIRRSDALKHFSVWILFGVLVGVLGALYLEYSDTSIKTESQARRWLGAPVLGEIPALKEIRRKAFQELIPEFGQGRPTMEAFRNLRTQVEFKSIDKPRRSLLVTSARPGEGKTSVLSNLAVAFAQKGDRTLMVDCDLRRPSLTRHMDLAPSPGLSNAVMGEVAWRDAVQETDLPNLWVMTVGDVPVHPSELLDSAQMRLLVEEFSSTYDRVLFDTSSALAVTDAAVLGAIVDGVILVVKAGKTPWRQAQRSLEILDGAGADVLGVALNEAPGYGGAFGYDYYYSDAGVGEAG